MSTLTIETKCAICGHKQSVHAYDVDPCCAVCLGPLVAVNAST